VLSTGANQVDLIALSIRLPHHVTGRARVATGQEWSEPVSWQEGGD